MIAVVTGCRDCPMYNAYYAGETISGEVDTGAECCTHPLAPVDSNNEMLEMQHENLEVITPDWCPLRKQSLLIKLADA